MDDEKPQEDKSIIQKVTDTAKAFAETVVDTTSEALKAAVTPDPNTPNVIVDPASGTAVVLPPVAPPRKTRPASSRARKPVAVKKAAAKNSKGKSAKKSRKTVAKKSKKKASKTSPRKMAKKTAKKSPKKKKSKKR